MGMSQLINEASGLLATFTAEKNKVTAAVSAALSAITMGRNYYVDAVLGSDDNVGSVAAPFKTIKKAIDTVPIGGYGSIELMPDQVHVIPYGKTIGLINKRIEITGKSGQPKASITNETVFSASANTMISSGFTLKNSSLFLKYLKLKTSNRPVGYEDYASNGYGIIARQDFSSGYVGLYGCEVDIHQTSFMRVPNGGADLSFSAYSSIITTPGAGKLIDLDGGAPIQALFNQITLPAGVKLADLISNIVRDVNVNPINILCNVPLPATV